jgi:hypothetical protein
MTQLRLLVPVLGLCLLLGEPSRSADPPKIDPKDKPKFKLPSGHELMLAKLKNSQLILEGIALGDFKKITSSSEELVRIAQVAEFLNAYKGREYELQMLLFKRSADTMTQKAKDKNMDGVLLAYTDMTMTCLKCHQHTRDKGDAQAPGLKLDTLLTTK